MRGVWSLVAVVVLAAVVTSACGQQRVPGNAAAGPASPSTVSSTVPSSGPATSAPRGCPSGTVVVSADAVNVGTADNGKALCVRPGTEVMVILQGTLARKWTPIRASSTALTPRASAGLTLMVGATAAYFTAAHAGTSVISSARPACTGATVGGPVSDKPNPGGPMHCDVLQSFHVTVVVSS